MFKYKTFNEAFTLAEVLITLGIIGIVAAMTMPSLIQNAKKHEATSRLKKFSAMMSQAILFAENDNGAPASEWIVPGESCPNPQECIDSNYAYWNKYFAPYVKSIKITRAPKIYFSDGTTVALTPGSCIDLHFDINGAKKPNEYGKDIFIFFIATKKTDGAMLYKNTSFGATYLPVYNTREKALNACKSTPYYCSAVLQHDNFEFKDDYPIKL